ncbi:MAG: ribosome recycling factor [Candidatus Levybacteria bacterium RBG_16_35_6]|nr:MAG: ribosome recycling factor [Candidatus Levybacteria bacterium RBG_16_35_6]
MDPIFLSDIKNKMQKVPEIIKSDLSTIRTGRAAPSLVENITISAYGGTAKLKVIELASVATSDSQTILITPFDQTVIGEIRKGIEVANVGLTPVIDGAVIRISIPPLSQERREELVHLLNQKLEGGRIQIRQIRHEAMQDIKKEESDKNISEDEKILNEKEIQKLTDETIETIDSLGERKKEELMQV